MLKKRGRIKYLYFQFFIILFNICLSLIILKSENVQAENEVSDENRKKYPFYKFYSNKRVPADTSNSLNTLKMSYGSRSNAQTDIMYNAKPQSNSNKPLLKSNYYQKCLLTKYYTQTPSNFDNEYDFSVETTENENYDENEPFISIDSSTSPRKVSAHTSEIDLKNSTPESVDILPSGCSYVGGGPIGNIVICTGLNMTSVPVFKNLRSVEILEFNSTGIQVIDKWAIEGLPKVQHLVFAQGSLMRVSFGELLDYQLGMTNLSLVHNSISSLSFSNFYYPHDKDVLRVLDLRHNMITNLPEVPVNNETVLHSLEVLILSGNPMGVIPGDLFYPLRNSPLKILILREAGLKDFRYSSLGGGETKGRSPFVYLQNLEILDLSRNRFLEIDKVAALIAPLKDRYLKQLILDDNSYTAIPTAALDEVKSSLEVLSMIRSSLYCLDNSSFPSMPNLQVLKLQYSRIRQIMDGTFNSLKSLTTLHLDGNLLTTMFPALSLTTLKILTLDENPSEGAELSFTIDRGSMKHSYNLEQLSMQLVPLNKVYNYYFEDLISLRSLKLSHCFISIIEDESFINLSQLHDLHLRNNKIERIDKKTFLGLSNLIYLDLSDNELRVYPASRDEDPVINNKIAKLYKFIKNYSFSSNSKDIGNFNDEIVNSVNISSYIHYDSLSTLYNLITLNLQNNYIDYLNPGFFKYLGNLQAIDLNYNNVKEWYTPIFNNNTYLHTLLLRNNDINSITDAMIIDFSKSKLMIDLRDNDFTCSCSLSAFENELNETLFYKKNSYTCQNGSKLIYMNAYIASLHLPCPESQVIATTVHTEHIKLYGTLLGIVTICFTVTVTTYRNRWYLKYLAFKFRVKLRLNSRTDSNMYEYDIFVCYSHADRQWIFEKLIGKLEAAGSGLTVCAHERDFVVGEKITNNIIRSVEISRKVLIILSRAFLQSNWCMFELEMATNTILDQFKSKLILLLLEPIPEVEQPKSLKVLMSKRTYVAWASDIEGEKLFWTRLIKAISKPNPGVEHSTLNTPEQSNSTEFLGSESSISSVESCSNSDFREVFESKDNSRNEIPDVHEFGVVNPLISLINKNTNVKYTDVANNSFINQGFVMDKININNLETQNGTKICDNYKLLQLHASMNINPEDSKYKRDDIHSSFV